MGSNSWTGDGFAGEGVRRPTRRSFLGGAGALAVAGATGALIAGCGDGSKGGSGSAGTEDVTFLTIVPLNLGYVSELLGDINGHFRKEGLNVTIQSTRGSAQALQSILQGSALATRAGAIESILHNAKAGAPLVNIGMQWRKSPLRFVSSPDRPLRRPADWRGKKMGVPSKGGTSEITFDLMLASADIPLDSVQRQVSGFSVGTYDLIEKGRIDSYALGSVETVQFPLRHPDAVIVDPSEYVEEGQCYLTSQRQLAEKRDVLQAYMNVVRAGMQDVLNDREKNYMTIVNAVRKKHEFEELKDDKVAQGIIKQQAEAWFYDGAKEPLKTVPEDWQRVYDQLVKAGHVQGGKKPAEWFTNDLVS